MGNTMRLQRSSQEDIVAEQSLMESSRLRNPGVTILNEILKTVRLDENLIATNRKILGLFLQTFFEKMKEQDELFHQLYRNPYYTGSFYTDLRISEPNEFDIDIILKFPFKPGDIEVNYHPQVPSYARYRLKDPAAMENKHPLIVKKFFVGGFLNLDSVRRWSQSVVVKALNDYKYPQGIIGILQSSSGPARTLILVKQNGEMIDIDLVPVVPYIFDTKQPGIDHRVLRKCGPSLEAFLVPKPFSPSGQCPVSLAEIPRLWRTHFPGAEKDILLDLGCAKPVIRLLKLLRDLENWKILASYYLKTVVMWMILENNSKEYWKEDKLDLRFIEALHKLANFVDKQKIPYFFTTKCNLISKMEKAEAICIYHRLLKLIKDVEKDRRNLWDIFDLEPSF